MIPNVYELGFRYFSMDIKTAVEQIMDTYELSPGQRKRLSRIAIRRLNEKFVYSFDNQYRYVVGLVEACKEHDSKKKQPWQAYPQDLVDRTDPAQIVQQRIDQQTTKNHSSTVYTMNQLKPYLEKSQHTFIQQMLETVNSQFTLQPKDIIGQESDIRNHMEQIGHRYTLGDRILFPKRPLQSIAFDPLKVTFGKRERGFDPVSLYSQYQSCYGSISRHELFRVDQGLYQALRYTRDLESAIPDAYQRRSKDDAA